MSQEGLDLAQRAFANASHVHQDDGPLATSSCKWMRTQVDAFNSFREKQKELYIDLTLI